MKKRLLSLISVLVIVCTMLFEQVLTAAAAEEGGVMIDGSYLTMEESSEGSTTSNPLLRGEHLMDGNSGISKAGRGRIYAYGSTTANHDVDFISVVVYVEQLNEQTGTWAQVATWTVEDENTYYVSTGKTVKVPRGYYYRVRCDHFAGNKADPMYDGDTSFTNGIKVD